MADSTTINYVNHIETYVDSSSSKSPAQQDESLDAIAKLLMSDMITLESLVREMGMYLTTTDNIIRARGILLLAELLTRISSKPLEKATTHSLIGFFAERLSDWRALRGALLGCLTLMRRKDDISNNDASTVAQSFMQNLQVQSLGQHDRKLCFEILECLIEYYPDSVLTVEDDFLYVICEAIDGEKDPQCLLLTFHLVEMLANLYPDSSDSLTSYAEDLFNILGSYFPIHFTHPKGEDDVKREELSRALMLAFASTSLFEPFSIPLLLEKLSSSLPSSKVESLKYLSYCTLKYGPHKMLQHLEPLWLSLKETIFSSGQSTLTVGPHNDNKIISEALILLQNLLQQDKGEFVNLIIKDVDINTTLKSLSNYNNYNGITVPDQQKLNSIGRILYISTKSSIASCNAIFQTFFSNLVKDLGSMNQDYKKFGHIYICVELLAGCRDLVINNGGPTFYNENETFDLLASFFVKSIKESNEDVYNQFGVQGLKILGSFPGSFSPVSKSTFENILKEFISIIILNFNNTNLWRFVLDSLIEIGLFIEKSQDSEKKSSFDVIVVKNLVDLLSFDDSTIPFSLKVKLVSEIGMINLNYMMKVVEELNKSIITNLHKSWIDGNLKSTEHAIILLECYDDKVLPWFQNVKDSDDVATRFVLKIWDEIEDNTLFYDTLVEKKLLETTMNTMKNAVATCSEDNQTKILEKSFIILSSNFKVNESNLVNKVFQPRHEWIISLFDSVIIALHPKTNIKNPEKTLQILIKSLTNGHIPSCHALGSFLNKFPSKESIDNSFTHLTRFFNGDNNNDGLININVIIGLSYMGKGLLMRGHEKVKDVIKFFLDFLILNSIQDQENVDLMKVVADSFNVMMSDSENCLNKRLNSVIKPLYKQRLFSIVMPVLSSSIVKSDSPITRSMMHRALAHVIYNTPLSAVLGEAKKLIPLILDGLTILSEDVENRDILYNLLLVLSGILTDKNGQEVFVENAYIIIKCINKLVIYPHMMLVRETAIQCLTAMSALPYARIYPFRQEVVQALLKALDDSKRSVRQEAVKCRQAWASISSRSFQI